MTKIINPLLLTPADSQQIFDFFVAQAKLGIFAWNKDQIYTFSDNTQFQFTHNIVQRKCKEGKEGVRYEILSDTVLGKGRKSIVYEIAGTLAIEPGAIRYKKARDNNKTRAIKVQEHHERKYPVSRSMIEYKLSQSATHLSVKEPTIQGRLSFSVMRKLEGEELFTIIQNDHTNRKKLELQQRIALSKILLNALRDQVTNKGIIHRDLKPENIIVDLSAPIKANIIDFGLSIATGAADDNHPGTPAYAAPEIFDSFEHTTKADVFSIGRVLALIWRVSARSYVLPTIVAYAENAKNIDLSSLFTGITGLSLENQTIIRHTLTGMLRKDVAERFSVDEAIAWFDHVVIQKPICKFFIQSRTTSRPRTEEVMPDRQLITTYDEAIARFDRGVIQKPI